jgi:hypothetical protein
MHAVDQQRAALQRVEECLRSFVDRELCGLLRASDLPLGSSVAVGDVRLATNRLDVELCRSNSTSPRVCLTWEEEAGRLRASVSQTGWLVELDESSRAVVTTALTGLFQRAGVDEVVGLIRLSTDPPVTWRRWVRAWSSPSVGLSAEDGSCESVVPSESAAGESVPATSIPVASSVDNR